MIAARERQKSNDERWRRRKVEEGKGQRDGKRRREQYDGDKMGTQ